MGYGTTSALRLLDPDEKRRVHRADLPGNFLGTKTPSANFISEPGLYKLIQRSSKPEARDFDRWVRHEVLPQIRANGGYAVRDADMMKVPPS